MYDVTLKITFFVLTISDTLPPTPPKQRCILPTAQKYTTVYPKSKHSFRLCLRVRTITNLYKCKNDYLSES